ncbi:hypothetical protein AX774_g2933 [Zancudomyces culisetae]|uniref:Uncharacterized protein n=1 Tax=Zancudomyces culisetae TaxID=1213189 RepID=A0A1R1PRH4_ZANCU|nr:hypothetical protein AX774_g2933 [Zancudomyces culisetae]|eukprot:OMH83558.1 hypothetical protein AX774_g2933 [Zancudomyces culisetae]
MTRLTSKVCWLLAVTGFMRPSDLFWADDAQTTVSKEHISIIVVAPKEKREGSPIIKEIKINSHSDRIICLVAAYTEYKKRTGQNIETH